MPRRHAPIDELSARASALAEAGEWKRLRSALEQLDDVAIAEEPTLAYRYGEALYHTGRMEELRAFGELYTSAARSAGDPTEAMRALNLSGIAGFELGDVTYARARFESLMTLAEAAGDEDMLARAANNLGALANLRGHRHEALALYRLSIPLYQRCDQPRGLAQTHHNLGLTCRDLGRLSEAAAAFQRAIELARIIDYQPLVAMSIQARAEVELLRDDLELAGALSERGVDLARELDDPITTSAGLRVLALARHARGEPPAETTALLDEALRIARGAGHRLIEAEIERDAGRIARERGGGGEPEGERRLRVALEIFRNLGAVPEIEALEEELEGGG